MKDRIKSFYKEHEDLILCFAAGLTLGAIIATKNSERVLAGTKVVSVGEFHNKEGVSFLHVHHKNGETTTLRETRK
jgi:hypothetical protein